MPDSDRELRQELIEARKNIVREMEILQNPIRFYDQYPEGIAKLRATLVEVDKALAEIDSANR